MTTFTITDGYAVSGSHEMPHEEMIDVDEV
jgi:hypothetical protein